MNRTNFNIESARWAGATKILEEASELSTVIAKLIAMNGEPTYFDGTNLEQRLIEEIGDLRAALSFFLVHQSADFNTRVDRRHLKKSLTFADWRQECRKQSEKAVSVEEPQCFKAGVESYNVCFNCGRTLAQHYGPDNQCEPYEDQ